MQPKLGGFRPGGGSVLPAGPTGRPSATSVGVGPIGCDVRGFDVVDERAAQNVDTALALYQFGIGIFDYWVKSKVAEGHAAAATQAIRDARHFDPAAYARWSAAYAAATPEAQRKDTCAACFGDPFAGVLVQQNLYTEVVEDGEYAYSFEEPMIVLDYAGPGEVTGYETTEPSAGPTIGAVPRLQQRVAFYAGRGSIDSFANDILTQVWFVLTMRAVVLAPRSAWAWKKAEERTVDRRPPGLLTKLLRMLPGG
jgi:hypothetical protein